MDDESVHRDPLTAAEGQLTGWGSLAGWTEPDGPTTVPRYRILGPLGIGGMGVVYRAEDTLLGRLVALKFLPPALTPNPRAKARFLNEARAAAALDHPNICTIYEVGETAEDQLYLVMAYYQGETLKQRLQRGPLPAGDALHIVLQVARGLAQAHLRGIVHRDIKPANLMITADGTIKILDFGIARLPDQALTGPPLGTPGYMSPEQARGGAVDARTDVWSLGVVLHEMLTGRLLGGHKEDPQGEEQPVPILWEVSPGIDGILSRMLVEDPAKRYQDAAQLLANLAALEQAVPNAERARAPGPAGRRLRAWALALVAALSVVAGFWLLRRHAGTESGFSQATLTRLTDLPGKEWFPSLHPDGSLLVYARKVGDLSRLFLQQVGGRQALDLLPDSQEGDSQPAFSPDGGKIAFRSEREGGGIFVMGMMGDSLRRVTDFGFNPAWSPDGKEILYATEGVDNPQIRRHPSEIYRVSVATGRRRLVHKGDAVQPSWSPHGFRIAYWGNSPFGTGRRRIWTVPANGGEAVPVTEGESLDWNPVWSPDGRYLFFASDRRGVTNLWRLPIDERSGRPLGEPEPVATSSQPNMFFSLSRDGRRIVYASDETRTILEKVAFEPASEAIAGPAEAIAETSDIILSFDVSPDGRWIVYQTAMPQEDLFLIGSGGTGWRQLTDDAYKDRVPRWSPDGTRIAFYSNRGGRYEIWTIRADGSQLERAAVTPGRSAYNPLWSPDGRWLACTLGGSEALIDLKRPVAERRPHFLPPAGRGLVFLAASWSADGRWLAGVLRPPNERQVPGVVLFSLAGRRYVQVTKSGRSALWLSDSRRLLYRDSDKIFLLDTMTRESRQVLAIHPGSEYNDFSLSADDRVLYLARNMEQGNIWLLTMN